MRTARNRLQGLATALLLASHALGATASAASGSSVGDRERPRLGSGFPNVELVRHDGAVVRFQDDLVEDRVFVLNFMYTTCADVCPLETARLSEVQAILGDRIGRDVFMYSITIDPERDTPEVLAAYRERFGVESGWDFYTGRAEDLLALRRALGLYFDDLEDEYDHNISLVIGNGETGHLIRRTPFDNPYALATQITSSIRDHGEQGVGVASYAEAPVQLPRLHAGARLFQSKCSVCHALGEEDGQLRIGPNLGGVTGAREPEWLLRWILEPDEVLAEGDPTARALFEAYNEVPMPDLGLSEEEAQQVLEFMTAEDRRLGRIYSNDELLELQGAEAPECCQKDELGVLEPSSPEAPISGALGWLELLDWPHWLGGSLILAGLVLGRTRR